MLQNEPRRTRSRRRSSGAEAQPGKTERISVRVSQAQRELLDEASRVSAVTLTDFILQAATTRAEDVLADRRSFAVPEEAYRAFLALLDRPVQAKPRLHELLDKPSLFD